MKNDFRDDLKSLETETSPDIETNPDQFSAEILGKGFSEKLISSFNSQRTKNIEDSQNFRRVEMA